MIVRDGTRANVAFAGNLTTDASGRLADVVIIGYTPKPAKADQLTCGADAATTELAQISMAPRTTPSAALPNYAVLRSSGAAARRRARRQRPAQP